MKTSTAFCAAVAAVAVLSGAANAQKEDGWCKDTKNCEKGYECVSVQTTRGGATEVKQCLPTKSNYGVCSGLQPGLCPSFSTWSTKYKSISSVCAYFAPGKGIKCAKEGDEPEKGEVACIDVMDSDNETVSVFYGCVDFDGSGLLFQQGSESDKLTTRFDFAEIVRDSCLNPKNEAGSDVVCSGRGTCAPDSAKSVKYSCKCNVGYDGKYCQRINSNECALPSQCAAGTCDLTKQVCKCEDGTRGDQCAECDPDSPDACNKRGKCLAQNGTSMCQCEERYAGAHCDRVVQKLKEPKPRRRPSNSTQSTTDEDNAAPSPSIVLGVLVSMTVVAATLF